MREGVLGFASAIVVQSKVITVSISDFRCFDSQDALCETAYQAEVAGLELSISPEGASGIQLRLDGFAHRLPALAHVVFTRLATLQVHD